MSDFEWGHHMPGEVVSAGRAGITSPSSRPTPPSGSARTGLDAHLPALVLREAEDSASSAGVGTEGASLPVAASSVPPKACVYMFAGLDGELLYVGCTEDLRRRVGEHRRTAPWWAEARWFDAAALSTLAVARYFEARLVGDLQPVVNKHYIGWRLPGLPSAAVRGDLLAIGRLQAAYADYAEQRYQAMRLMVARLLVWMPDEDTTVEQAVHARKDAQPPQS